MAVLHRPLIHSRHCTSAVAAPQRFVAILHHLPHCPAQHSSVHAAQHTLGAPNQRPAPAAPIRRAAPGTETAGSAAASSSSCAQPPDLPLNVYVDAAAQLPHFVGPVQVADIPGKGRGLVASAPLSPGQLLLVVPPLVLLEGPLGCIPEHDELFEVITSSGALFSSWQAAWLKALTTTTGSSSGSNACDGSGSNDGSSSGSSRDTSVALQQQQQQQQRPPVVPAFLPPPGEATWLGAAAVAGSGTAATAAAAGRVPFEALGMDEEQLWAAIVLNCYGEGFADLPASLCAAAPLSSQLGLWGAFSLLNHACCPNAVNYTLRDCMVVRACQHIPEGAEVVINYLGRSAFTPLSQRQAELQACYGFECDCRRCKAEASWDKVSTAGGGSLTAFLDNLHALIGYEFVPRRAQLMEEHESSTGQEPGLQADQQQQQQLQQLVSDMQQQWVLMQEAAQARASSSDSNSSSSSTGNSSSSSSCSGSSAAAKQAPLDSEEACWVLAAGYDLLGLLHECTTALGQPPGAAVMDALVGVCEKVCPGSDLHVFQALRRTSLQQQQAQPQQPLQPQQHQLIGGGVSVDDSMRALEQALQVRYGPHVAHDRALLQQLVAATSAAANMVVL